LVPYFYYTLYFLVYFFNSDWDILKSSMGVETQKERDALIGAEKRPRPARKRSRMGRIAILLSTLPLLGFGPAPVNGDNQAIGMTGDALALIPDLGDRLLSVTSYNIADGREKGIAAVAEVLQRETPTVACIQEVSSKNFSKLARQSGLAHAEPAWAHTIKGGYNFCLANLSSMPITATEVFPLYRDSDHAQRILQVATLDNQGQPLMIANTHLVNKEAGIFGEDRGEERLRQARDVARILAQPRFAGTPTVLCGDFNTGPGSEPYEVLMHNFSDTTRILDGRMVTFPGFFHQDQKDFIAMSRDNGWQPLQQHTSGAGASDHFALTALVLSK
jgi:endonuclease/exonuclease/phosphatase family metal-dependent hydrolase